ncbi:MAG: DUF3090 family protein [Acidimicrobiales bacterium]|nr:DUF3090 family protein [Acidimicrobiales bacterium]
MSASFELPEVERFTTGSIGPPGQRAFFLQVRGPGGLVSLKVEKLQVTALADYLEQVLDDLPSPPAASQSAPGLEEPVVAEWAVGSLAVAVEADEARILVVAEELVDAEAGEEGASARFRLTYPQVAMFVRRAREAVAGGRPPCRLCGRPLDPEGHVCPRTNGHGVH